MPSDDAKSNKPQLLSNSVQAAPKADSHAPANPKSAPAEAATTSAGAGGLLVLAAKVFFLAAGLVQQAVLPRLIGLADYGALARVLSASNIPNNVVVTASLQSVSRLSAQSGAGQAEALRFALRIHVILALLVAGGFAFAAPAIGAFQHAPHIVVPLTIMAVVLFVYALYAPLVGALNGRRKFGQQALLDMVAATLRTLGFAVGGWLLARRGYGTLGAAAGASIAALCMLPLAIRFSGALRRTSAANTQGHTNDHLQPELPTPRLYLRTLAGLMVAQLTINLLMQSDITLLGRALSVAAESGAIREGARRADEWIGVYRACQLFAFLPYQLLFSVTSVLFPMLAKAAADGDSDRVAMLTERGVRIGVLFTGLMVAVVIAFPEALLRIAYSANVAAMGGATLRTLAAAQGCFAILGLATTVLTSLGSEVRAGLINGLALTAVSLTIFLFGNRFAFGAPQLQFVATATASAMLFALAIAWPTVQRTAGAFAAPFVVARVVLLVVGLTVAAGQIATPQSRIGTLMVLACVGVGYLAGLPLLGLVSVAEIRAAAALLRARIARRSSGPLS